MKKIVKLSLKIFAGLIGLIVLAAILLPIIFKDDIREAIDSELDKALTATVFYDVDAFSVSLIRSFPNISVRMGNFGIKGKDVFESDTLAYVKNFELTVDLMSVFSDITVNKIQLDDPKILVLVLEDGTANYDIVAPSEEIAEEETTEEESSPAMAINIDRWEINNAQVVYMDQSLPFYISLLGLNHSGSGNLQADIFQMVTNTTAGSVSLGYDGTEYVTNKSFSADVIMNMDMANMSFTFAENRVAVNDFGFGFDGSISMPGDDIAMDITFAGSDIDMKSVLSLIPGAYQEYLDGISASGKIAFDGLVKGTYNDESMPRVMTKLSIADGKISTPDAPAPLEKIKLGFTFDYPSADLAETNMQIDFGAEMAGQKSSANVDFRNLDNYQWDVKANLDMDMAKLSKVLPMDSMELRGIVQVALATAGKMSDVEAENWAALPTSGSFKANDFYFAGPDLPQGFGIAKADASFNPSNISLTTFQANAGRTDLNLSGKLENYIAFALGDDEKLVGNLDFTSKLIDVDEWMVAEEVETVEEESTDTTVLEVVRIPANIDFVLNSAIEKIKYTNLSLDDFNGKVLVKDGSVILDNTSFNLLSGQFVMTGAYETLSENPTFNFDFGIKELSIPKAFDAFSPIKKMIPIAEKTTGNFSTNFKMNGALGQDMMPLMNSLSGSGLVEIAEAAISDVKLLEGIQQIANLKGKGGTSEKMAQLKDVLLSMKIEDGRVSVKPFDLTIAGNKTVVSGSSGLDGSLDYAMAMQVPSGEAGKAINGLVSNLTGASNVVSDFLDLNIGIGGTYADPKIKLLGAKPSKGEGSLKASVKEQANEKIAEAKAEVKEQVTEAVDSLKNEANSLIDDKKKEAEAAAKKKAEDAVKNLFKKKKN